MVLKGEFVREVRSNYKLLRPQRDVAELSYVPAFVNILDKRTIMKPTRLFYRIYVE